MNAAATLATPFHATTSAADAAPPAPWDATGPRPERLARWLEHRLRHYPRSAEALVVELRDPHQPTAAEQGALTDRLRRSGMAIYASTRLDADPTLPRQLARHLGLQRLDSNWLADDEGISHLQVQPGIAAGMDYIPYTNRALGWHTDGYYNPGDRQVHALLLHCVRPAASGGANRLLDHALAAALLMQREAALAAALFHPEAMSIPPRVEADGSERPRQTGPVLSVRADGALHMRYTARSVSIDWRDDDSTRAAAQALREILADSATPVLQARLQPGWGLVAANVLHDRSAFIDDPAAPRLIYRARFLDALPGMA
ncbi:TauD/TfdA family dioxygenase [Sphaerotilus microaerophilus]|uniref:TauD/TfdA-like domain-containing protein n=1 Tax=Sphaerotilus microaerophilus TaxID=2914710 RepID=A0ABN6PRY0_9BURK|nr:TauD/TfdA family dioxygenase [Sphaerotilus sp. FB-5]BDI07941.1 hypothetical protein CATMQ487_49110 [Sphaerotilus sp. FB-5]